MTSATAPLDKPLSMAECPIYSASTLFKSKSAIHPFLSLHSKPIKFINISCSSSSSYSFPTWVSLKNKEFSQSILVPCVSETSDWDQIEEEEEESPVNGVKWGDQTEASNADSWVEREEGFGDGEVSEEREESSPEPPEEAKLYVGNLPYEIDSEKLAQLFDQVGVVEIAEVIYNRETDQSRGFGFVTMSTVEEAEKAVQKFQGYDLNGRFLAVNKAAPRGSRLERGSRVERPPRVHEPSFRIYVGNLPWQVDNARLQQVFSEHGKVIDARVAYDRESGRSRGFGFVTMSSETELNDAIAALDGQSLDGRAIRVNVAEDRPRRSSF